MMDYLAHSKMLTERAEMTRNRPWQSGRGRSPHEEAAEIDVRAHTYAIYALIERLDEGRAAGLVREEHTHPYVKTPRRCDDHSHCTFPKCKCPYVWEPGPVA